MLTAETDYDGDVITGNLSGQSAPNARFLECTFQRCDLSEVRAPRSRFADTGMYAVHGAGVDLSGSSWLDCVVQGARFGAVALYDAELRRVRFEGCKIEFLNLRGASLAEVSFVDCQLLEPDFSSARLGQVDFSGSRLVAAEFAGATMEGVDLSGAELTGPRGLAALKGATISRLQLIELGPAIAAELGIAIVD